MQGTITELSKAIEESRKYLLSHHEEEQLHRCYNILDTHLCSRCTGIYPGIAAGMLLSFSNPISVVAALPAAAVTEKIGEAKGRKFTNPFRTFTGLLLGIAYGVGLTELLYCSTEVVAGIGLFYAAIGLVLLDRTEADFKLQ